MTPAALALVCRGGLHPFPLSHPLHLSVSTCALFLVSTVLRSCVCLSQLLITCRKPKKTPFHGLPLQLSGNNSPCLQWTTASTLKVYEYLWYFLSRPVSCSCLSFTGIGIKGECSPTADLNVSFVSQLSLRDIFCENRVVPQPVN